VRVTIEQLESKTLEQSLQTLAHTIGMIGWVADYPDPYTFLEIFRTGNGNNWTGWGSKEYDGLLDEAGGTLDAAKRFALLQQAEQILLREAPLATLVHVARTYLVHPGVKNWEPAPLGLNRFHVVRLER
jgi:oligopeptide transport system substrate-binding protein